MTKRLHMQRFPCPQECSLWMRLLQLFFASMVLHAIRCEAHSTCVFCALQATAAPCAAHTLHGPVPGHYLQI